MFSTDDVMQILKQAWPFVGQYLEKLLVETIAPSIRSSSAHLQTFNFAKVDLGDKVPAFYRFNLLMDVHLKDALICSLGFFSEKLLKLFVQPVKVVGVKAHTEQDRRQVLLDLYIRLVCSLT